MAKYTRFEQVPVWQEAARLHNIVLDLLEEPDSPLSWGFRNQLDRAALPRLSAIGYRLSAITLAPYSGADESGNVMVPTGQVVSSR
jgi:hypothetical protein